MTDINDLIERLRRQDLNPDALCQEAADALAKLQGQANMDREQLRRCSHHYDEAGAEIAKLREERESYCVRYEASQDALREALDDITVQADEVLQLRVERDEAQAEIAKLQDEVNRLEGLLAESGSTELKLRDHPRWQE